MDFLPEGCGMMYLEDFLKIAVVSDIEMGASVCKTLCTAGTGPGSGVP